MSSLRSLLDAIAVPDPAVAARAQRRLDELTKPPGSLGRLEDLAVALATLAGGPPRVDHPVVFVLAADHGVVAEGVSAYPQIVTAQMLENFLRGRRRHQCAGAPGWSRGRGRRLRRGRATGFGGRTSRSPARRRDRQPRPGAGDEPRSGARRDRGRGRAGRRRPCRGRGSGDYGRDGDRQHDGGQRHRGRCHRGDAGAGHGAGHGHRRRDVAPEGRHRRPGPCRQLSRSSDAVDVLARVGGFEIAGLVGIALAGAARRVPVVLDGFIAGAAALLAVALAPATRHALFAAHRSAEPGHTRVLEHLGLRPYLELSLRLGEGTGGALFVHLARAAARLYAEMATFKSMNMEGGTRRAPLQTSPIHAGCDNPPPPTHPLQPSPLARSATPVPSEPGLPAPGEPL